MRASKREGEWKCFKKAGSGCLRTAGFKHIGRFSKSRGIFDSDLTHQGLGGERQRTKKPSIPEGLDCHISLQMIGMVFFNKKKCNAQHHQHSFIIFFSIVAIVRSIPNRHIAMLKATLLATSKLGNNLTNMDHSEQSSAGFHT